MAILSTVYQQPHLNRVARLIADAVRTIVDSSEPIQQFSKELDEVLSRALRKVVDTTAHNILAFAFDGRIALNPVAMKTLLNNLPEGVMILFVLTGMIPAGRQDWLNYLHVLPSDGRIAVVSWTETCNADAFKKAIQAKVQAFVR